MLQVRNLHARIGDKEILRGIDLDIKDGETHAIMGPNGSGKSTLSAVLVGNPQYEVTEGTVTFNGKDYMFMHGYDSEYEYRSKLLVCDLTWTPDGWPKVDLK